MPSTPPAAPATDDLVDPAVVVAALREQLPAGAVLTSDAGNFFGWVARYGRFTRPGTFLGPTSGAMGYAVPAAVAASLVHGGAVPVVALAGDGGFLMTSNELAVAAQLGLPRRLRRLRQRPVRHDPSPPGAGVSRPRRGHRNLESRLRPLRAGVRRTRHPGRAQRRRARSDRDGPGPRRHRYRRRRRRAGNHRRRPAVERGWQRRRLNGPPLDVFQMRGTRAGVARG